MDYKKDIIIYDFETIKGCFLASFFIPSEKKWIDFVINKYKNQMVDFVSFIKNNSDKYFIGYNNLNFDAQVAEFIIRNHEKWIDLPALSITSQISRFGGDVIEAQNYGLFLPYREDHISFKNIDLPRIWHFFNENKRVSLKQLEFEMRSPVIENFEVEVNKEDFTEKEVEDLIFYCHNDVENTYKHYLFTIGETEHQLYKGKDKINDRVILMEEVGLDCLNWDDVKIGAEWNKKDYMEMSHRDEKSLKPKKVNHYYGKKFKTFFPKTVEFQTQGLKDFLNTVGNTPCLNEKQEFKYSLTKDLKITIAKGGIHSNEGPRFIKPEAGWLYIQNDIGSQYPNFLRKNGLFPFHLGKEWFEMLVGKIQRRLGFKKLYKETKEPKYNSLQEMGKLSLNGGGYGKLGEKGNWQEDPSVMLKVTIGCQLEILMIVEALILKGFEVVSCNTDGWDAVVEESRLQEYFDICEYYEKKIGNDTMGQVEYTIFEWIAQLSVNDYLAKKKGEYVGRKFIPHKSVNDKDYLKSKGDFEYWKELNKNTSFSIIPLALQKYFDEGIDPEEFINSRNDIFDYCARSNSGKTYTHFIYHEGKKVKAPKLIRYYVAKKGNMIEKVVNPNVDTGARDMNVRPAEKQKRICNRLLPEMQAEHMENVDKSWYINEVNETLRKINRRSKKVKYKEPPKEQLNLFK